jgi:hypothetical protein
VFREVSVLQLIVLFDTAFLTEPTTIAEELIKADAVLINAAEESINTDAVLINTVEELIKADAVLINAAEESIKADAVLINTAEELIKADAVLINAAEESINTAAVLINAAEESINTAAVLINAAEESIKADAVLINAAEESIKADAGLINAAEEFISQSLSPTKSIIWSSFEYALNKNLSPIMSTFSTFRKFTHLEQAEELVDLLEDNQIPYEVEDSSPDMVLASSESVQKEIRVKLKQEDFTRANALLETLAQSFLENVSKDHYLFEFSDEELHEILEKPDEWGKNDYALAKKILKERGKDIAPEKLAELQNTRTKELAKPEGGQTGWIIFGYISAFCGGGLGIFFGWYLMSFKKTLPDGRKVYAYTPDVRKHGRIIFFIGIPSLIIWTVVKLHNRIKFYN